jgi:hypothetical protein
MTNTAGIVEPNCHFLACHSDYRPECESLRTENRYARILTFSLHQDLYSQDLCALFPGLRTQRPSSPRTTAKDPGKTRGECQASWTIKNRWESIRAQQRKENAQGHHVKTRSLRKGAQGANLSRVEQVSCTVVTSLITHHADIQNHILP